MPWEFDAQRPIYLQIMERFKLGILSGEYPPGSRAPTVRELADKAKVNPNTMQKAYMELEREGMVYTNRTSGRYVTQDEVLIAAMRGQMAQSVIAGFVEQMTRLGFTRQEMTAQIENYQKGE